MEISVVVPAFNSEKTIGQCLASLLNQTFPRESYEVIVVNDGSTDSTERILKWYSVEALTQKNQGPAAARNAGVGKASGEIILFTDDDCVPSANWIEEMAKPFRDKEVAAVKGAYKTKQESVVARFAQIEFEERFEMLKKVEYIDMVDTYSAGYRKEIFLRMKGFDATFPVANNEDTELSYRMFNHGYKMIFNPNAVVCHLGHPDSVGRYASLKFWRGYWRMVVYKKFPDKMVKDTYTPQSLKLQILFLFLFVLSLPLAPLFPFWGRMLTLLVAAFFVLSISPFTFGALKKDFRAGIAAPFLLFVRAASIGLGILWGLLRISFLA